MDYGTLTSDSTPSTCATDSLSGGQSTMCALLNNTLAGKTYMGVYGEVAGSMIMTKYQFTKKTDGFDPANFLIYSMADGSIVGFNPSMKNCSLSGELTKSVLTDSNKLANCIGFIDVNGVSLPNKEVTCSDGTSALEPNNPCTLKSKPWGLGDVFPVVFHNGTVEPATNAAKAFFSGESSGGEQISNSGSYNPATMIYKPDVSSSGEPIYKNQSGDWFSRGDWNKKTINGVTYVRRNGYYYPVDESGNVDTSVALLLAGNMQHNYKYDSNIGMYVEKDDKGDILTFGGMAGNRYIYDSNDGIYKSSWWNGVDTWDENASSFIDSDFKMYHSVNNGGNGMEQYLRLYTNSGTGGVNTDTEKMIYAKIPAGDGAPGYVKLYQSEANKNVYASSDGVYSYKILPNNEYEVCRAIGCYNVKYNDKDYSFEWKQLDQ